MGTAVVMILVVVGGAALFSLAWWSSGRTKHKLARRNDAGDLSQGEAYFQANLQKTTRNDSGGFSGPFG